YANTLIIQPILASSPPSKAKQTRGLSVVHLPLLRAFLRSLECLLVQIARRSKKPSLLLETNTEHQRDHGASSPFGGGTPPPPRPHCSESRRSQPSEGILCSTRRSKPPNRIIALPIVLARDQANHAAQPGLCRLRNPASRQ